jgi:DNA invertase Pin-like site-specific DNA recombinase
MRDAMKSAVYIRVSTLDQASGAKSQEHAINRYLKAHGLKAKWFRDTMSGSTTDRPAFAKLQKAIFNGEVSTVVVWKLDRLSRSLIALSPLAIWPW